MRSIALAYAVSLLVLAPAQGADKADKGKIPITTASEDARKAYLEARDLNEKLRAGDARLKFQEAVAKDPKFALAHLGAANTSITAQEFWDELKKAGELAAGASEGEQLLIQFAEANAKGETDKATKLASTIAGKFPQDERAQVLLGGLYFGRQQWDKAVPAYKKAVAINPEFSAPYNQLGYALRFLEKYDEAEKVFQKYVELIPNDPNPYDSYGELLMKLGRFDESIRQYEKALAVNKNFIASYVGIGHNQMFMGRGDDARRTFGELTKVARNDGERRTAIFWTAQSYVMEGATDKALAEMQKMADIDEKNKDLPNLVGVNFNMGEILLEAGRPDEALARYRKQHEVAQKADVPPSVKEQADRNLLYNEAKVALAKGDVAKAKANAAEREKLVMVKKVTFEVQQVHELKGRIALEEKKYAAAATELGKANLQDARVLYLLGVAQQAAGNEKAAKASLTKAANYNGLGGNYGFVRKKAKDLLARS